MTIILVVLFLNSGLVRSQAQLQWTGTIKIDGQYTGQGDYQGQGGTYTQSGQFSFTLHSEPRSCNLPQMCWDFEGSGTSQNYASSYQNNGGCTGQGSAEASLTVSGMVIYDPSNGAWSVSLADETNPTSFLYPQQCTLVEGGNAAQQIATIQTPTDFPLQEGTTTIQYCSSSQGCTPNDSMTVTIVLNGQLPTPPSSGPSSENIVQPTIASNGNNPSTGGTETSSPPFFTIFMIIVIVFGSLYVWKYHHRSQQGQQIRVQTPVYPPTTPKTTPVQGKFHGHWEDNAGRYVPSRPAPPTAGPDPLGPYRWVTPEEEAQRTEARKRSEEWFKTHPPKHRTPPQPTSCPSMNARNSWG